MVVLVLLVNLKVLLFVVLIYHSAHHVFSLNEDERMEEYAARNYTWPPKLVPETSGWNRLMMRRFRQLEFVEDLDERYNGYLVAVGSAYVAPNFTENGWGLTRAPQELVDELKKALKDGMENNPQLEFEDEEDDGVIEHDHEDSAPLFVDTSHLNRKILVALKPYHEAWAGVPLKGAMAYGLRVYRNDSNLHMHVDKSNTHIISCILHVDHDQDPESEPWPIVIEDFQGNTNEVFLESGDLLFYESSKCLHGRPKRFKGKWYSSLFVHYYPAVNWELQERENEGHYGVPGHWDEETPDEGEMDVDLLEIIDTALKEPTCKDNWCALRDSVKWYGPAKYGEILTTGGKITPFHVEHDIDSSKHQVNSEL